MDFINTFWHNLSFEDIHTLDAFDRFKVSVALQVLSYTHPRKRKSHLIYFELVNQRNAHAVWQNQEGRNDVYNGLLRQGAGKRTDQIKEDV